jgi:hypothetical protein
LWIYAHGSKASVDYARNKRIAYSTGSMMPFALCVLIMLQLWKMCSDARRL